MCYHSSLSLPRCNHAYYNRFRHRSPPVTSHRATYSLLQLLSFAHGSSSHPATLMSCSMSGWRTAPPSRLRLQTLLRGLGRLLRKPDGPESPGPSRHGASVQTSHSSSYSNL